MSSLIRTRGIVFHKLSYSDNSLIVKIYTEELGIRSYVVRGIRARRSGRASALFSPLALLDLIVYERSNRDLQHLKEVKLDEPYINIPFDEARHSILLFINEILYRCIREEEANPGMFAYLRTTLLRLDDPLVSVGNFHLAFLMEMSQFLGFSPEDNHSPINSCFSLREGCFRPHTALDDSLTDAASGSLFARLMREGEHITGMNAASRRLLLQQLLDYYRHHLEGMGEIRSHLVLEQVFRP